MKSWNKAGKVRLALAAVLLITAGASQSWGAAQNTKGEGQCQTTIAKSLGKHASAVTKEMAECTNRRHMSDGVGPTKRQTRWFRSKP